MALTTLGVEADPAPHGVEHGFWLLKDLFLHEGLKVSCEGH